MEFRATLKYKVALNPIYGVGYIDPSESNSSKIRKQLCYDAITSKKAKENKITNP